MLARSAIQRTSLRVAVAPRFYSNQAPKAQNVTGPGNTPEPQNAVTAEVVEDVRVANVQQSPNYPTTWSTSQNPRQAAFGGPRFEQVNFDLQPQPVSAMQLVAEDPVRLVPGRKAVCDGGESVSWGERSVQRY